MIELSYVIILISFCLSLFIGLFLQRNNYNFRLPFIISIMLNLFILGVTSLLWNELAGQQSVSIYQSAFFVINVINFVIFIGLKKKNSVK